MKPHDPQTLRYRKAQMNEFLRDFLEDEGITSIEFISKRRDKPEVINARKKLCFALHERGYSYPEIGWLIDRDHTTVLHHKRAYMKKRGIKNGL